MSDESLSRSRGMLAVILGILGAGVMAFLFATIPGLRFSRALRHPANIVGTFYGWMLIVVSVVFIAGRRGSGDPVLRMALRYVAVLVYFIALAWFLFKSDYGAVLATAGDAPVRLPDPATDWLAWVFLAGNICVNLLLLLVSSFAHGFSSAVADRERSLVRPKKDLRTEFEQLRVAVSERPVDPGIARRLDALDETIRFLAPSNGEGAAESDMLILEHMQSLTVELQCSTPPETGALDAKLGCIERLLAARKRIFSD